MASIPDLAAIVKAARRELREHMEDPARHAEDEWPTHSYSYWAARRDRLKRYLAQEVERLHMMGGSIEDPKGSRGVDGGGVREVPRDA